jgi:hypothetical protein
MIQPSVYLVIGPSAIAYDERGEILETVDWLEDGKPDWSNGGICDHRGGGGPEGFELLMVALDAGEKNAKLLGVDVVRIPKEGGG